MNDTFKEFYRSHYTPPKLIEENAEVDTCHRQLIEHLSKEERKLVLRIIDAQNAIKCETALDGFIADFSLAMRLSQELNIFEAKRLVSCQLAEEQAVFNNSMEENPE